MVVRWDELVGRIDKLIEARIEASASFLGVTWAGRNTSVEQALAALCGDWFIIMLAKDDLPHHERPVMELASPQPQVSGPVMVLTYQEAEALYKLLEHEHIPYENTAMLEWIKRLQQFVDAGKRLHL